MKTIIFQKRGSMDRMPQRTSVSLLVLNLWSIKELDVEGIRVEFLIKYFKNRNDFLKFR